MKINILIAVIFLTTFSSAQNIYELQPGTKGNKIILSLANISESSDAENLTINLSKSAGSIIFKEENQTVERINPQVEKEITFTFDVKREISGNKKDTVEFTISNNAGVLKTKKYIFNYTVPKEYRLEQNFPNPFNPTTTIQYQLQSEGKVTLKIYDILGSEVATLVNEFQEAGYKEIKFDASLFSSGIYIYRLISGNYVSTKKMMLVK